MKTQINIVLFTLIMFSSAYGQVDRVDANGLKQGIWKESIPGENFEFALMNYFNDTLHGEFKAYYKNQKIAIIGFYYKGLLSGDHFTYYENGCLKSKMTYFNDTLNGERIEFYENGIPESVQFYKNGIHDSIYCWYYPNGNLHVKYQIINGTLNGYYKQYYEDAVINLEGQFKMGKEFGIWKKYNKKGILFDTNEYEKLKKLE